MDDLKAFIQQEIAQLAFKKVAYDESLIQSRLLDSITVVDLVVSIEEKTGKRVPQHLISEEHLDTIDKIAALIQTL